MNKLLGLVAVSILSLSLSSCAVYDDRYYYGRSTAIDIGFWNVSGWGNDYGWYGGHKGHGWHGGHGKHGGHGGHHGYGGRHGGHGHR